MSKKLKSLKTVEKSIRKFLDEVDKDMDELFDKNGPLNFVIGSNKSKKGRKVL